MDTKALGQDLVALGQRLSGLQADAIQTFSNRVQDRPAGAILLALGVGTLFGFLLGFVSNRTVFPDLDSAGAPSRPNDRGVDDAEI
jgi:hypothetical protein